jgi:hypothetical protein
MLSLRRDAKRIDAKRISKLKSATSDRNRSELHSAALL